MDEQTIREEYYDRLYRKTYSKSMSFVKANGQVFSYLNQQVDVESFFDLLHEVIQLLAKQYPVFSTLDYIKIFTRSFSYTDAIDFRADPRNFLISKFRLRRLTNRKSVKDWEHIEEFNALHSSEITIYLSCFFYNRLRTYQQFNCFDDYKQNTDPFVEAFDFYPISNTRFALDQKYWFKGRVSDAYAKVSNMGNRYGRIYLKDLRDRYIRGVVRSYNIDDLVPGIQFIAKNKCELAVFGRLIEDKYKEGVRIIETEKFVLQKEGEYLRFPVPYVA